MVLPILILEKYHAGRVIDAGFAINIQEIQ